jgi:hypothetical protein
LSSAWRTPTIPGVLRADRDPKGDLMKKLLVILILAAIGIAVAKKVRAA